MSCRHLIRLSSGDVSRTHRPHPLAPTRELGAAGITVNALLSGAIAMDAEADLPTDAGPREALHREIREGIGGRVDIVRRLHALETPGGDREDFYLAAITSWDFADRTGPEFARVDRGEYRLERVPATGRALAAVDLKPDAICDVLLAEVSAGTLSASADGG